MDGTRKYHPERGNPITKEHTWYAIADKWILTQKLGIPKIQFTDHMKLPQEGRPKCGYFDPYWKVGQNIHGSRQTNIMNIGSPMEQLEKGPKELKRFAVPQGEQ